MSQIAEFYRMFISDCWDLLGALRRFYHVNPQPAPNDSTGPDSASGNGENPESVQNTVGESDARRGPWLGRLHSLKSLSLAFELPGLHARLKSIEDQVFGAGEKLAEQLNALEEDLSSLNLDLDKAPREDGRHGSPQPQETTGRDVPDFSGGDHPGEHNELQPPSPATGRNSRLSGIPASEGKDSQARGDVEAFQGFNLRLNFQSFESLPLARLTVLLNTLRDYGVVRRLEPSLDALSADSNSITRPEGIEISFETEISAEELRRFCLRSGFIRPRILRRSTGTSAGSGCGNGSSLSMDEAAKWLSMKRLFAIRHGKIISADRLDTVRELSSIVFQMMPSSSILEEVILAYFSEINMNESAELYIDFQVRHLPALLIYELQILTLHLLNNSLDHGSGSDPRRIHISLYPDKQGGSPAAVLTYRDNGGWYEPGGVRALKEDPAENTAENPASNPAEVKRFSGRGLGLDIIHRQSARIGAELSAPPENPGPLKLSWPLETFEFDILICRGLGGTPFAVLTDLVRDISPFSTRKIIRKGAGTPYYNLNGKALPCLNFDAWETLAPTGDESEVQDAVRDYRSLLIEDKIGESVLFIVESVSGQERRLLSPLSSRVWSDLLNRELPLWGLD